MDVKEETYRKAQLIKIIYRDKLNIKLPIKFGIEIEFEDALFEDVHEYINSHINKITSKKAENYSIWNLTGDKSVQDFSDGKKYGGEIVSPILKNDIKSWKEIKKICGAFRIYNFNMKDRSSFHNHFDAFVFTNPNFERNLLKFEMLFEDIIYRFDYGRTNQERKIIREYAAPTNEYIYQNLDKFKDEKNFKLFVEQYSKMRKVGLSFYNVKREKGTYELRIGNGLETAFLIQNTINTHSHVLQYCNDTNFDIEYIDYLIKKFKPIKLEQFREENFDKALDFANLIFDKEIDKLYFMKQYLKCLEEEQELDDDTFVKQLLM